MKNSYILVATLLFVVVSGFAQNTISENKTPEVAYIWSEDTEGIDTSIAELVRPQGGRFYNIYNPSLRIFKPDSPNGVGIIICSGGSYDYVADGVEADPVACELNKSGVTVFALKYRLPSTPGVNFKHPVPLLDALRAIQYVRGKAEQYKVNPDKIGIMGFSAGGHLVSMAGTLYDKYSTGNDETAQANPRPDFVCLVYPVISTSDSIMHVCITKLVDSEDQNNLPDFLSTENNVTENTPPTFLVHAKDDHAVSYLNSLVMYEALIKNGVDADYKFYEKGGHGFGPGREGEDSANWINDFKNWLVKMNYM